MKSGLIFEKCLIEKMLKETGKCPITNQKLNFSDLLHIKISKGLQPRVTPLASIPSLIGIFHNEWDSLILENHQLKQQLALNRQELAYAIYQHDASCRVVARLLRERNEARNAIDTCNRIVKPLGCQQLTSVKPAEDKKCDQRQRPGN